MNQKFDAFLKWVVGEKSYQIHMTEMSNRMAITLNFIAILVSVIYVIVDLNQGYYEPLVTHMLLLGGCLPGIALIRLGKFFIAKIMVLSLCTLAIYVSVAAETYETGSHLYFFTIIVAAFVVFDFNKQMVSIFFAIGSLALYLLATMNDFSIVPEYNFTLQVTRSFFILNVTVFTFTTSAIIVLYIRRFHERNLRIEEQNEQLRKTNSELDQFVYSTSHDLKAPLASVLGLLNVLDITDDEGEKQKYHALIRNRIEKMDSFIRDIISLIKSTRLPILKESLNLYDTTQKTYNDLSYQSDAGKIQFKNEIPQDLEIESDRLKITTVLSNLLSNAIKYSDPRKKENVVVLSMEKEINSITISVFDNGIGIEEAQQPNIFDMFHRATDIAEGTGLGLYIAKETLIKLGGVISVKSKPGEGTTFFLTIPRK
ncbi:MAG: HAMP domain-containing histidine kinase [Saprospiraceae bacterium]|nr:HAMP domain-containing histidine kinase [Saprospiraceae bacterium]